MKRQSLIMSWEEYELLENPFGWKVEYWDGQAHFTPRHMGVKTSISLKDFPLPKRFPLQRYIVVPASEAYKEQIIDGYFGAFVNSVEFCDWPIKSIIEGAQEDIENYFAGIREEPLSVSVMVLEPDTMRLIGVALFVKKGEQEVYLRLLYVRSPYQRQGVATAMLYHGIRHLTSAKYQKLTSRYHVCNHQSRHFYHKTGFQDIQEPYYLRIKIGWLRNKIWRQEKLRMFDGIEELKKEAKQLQTEFELLSRENLF